MLCFNVSNLLLTLVSLSPLLGINSQIGFNMMTLNTQQAALKQ